MVTKRRVAVLMGGDSAEREVSLKSGAAVLAGLNPEKYDALPVDLQNFTGTASLPPVLNNKEVDLVFIALHGGAGEDGRIQQALDEIGLPYTGSGPKASAQAMDKIVSKNLFQQAGLPTVQGHDFRGLTTENAPEAGRRGLAAFGLPLVVKPAHEGSTIGITIVREEAALESALLEALKYGPDILIERYYPGREITAAIIGNNDLQVFPLLEIVPKSGFYDYHAKYIADDTGKICPAPLDETLAQSIRTSAKQAYTCLGCRGFARVDFIVNNNDFIVLEANTIPGLLGDHSLVPAAAQAAGLSFSDLVDRIIALADEEASP